MLIDFAMRSNVYNAYYPMLMIVIGTELRRGELIGLIWKDEDTRVKFLNVDCRLFTRTIKTADGFIFLFLKRILVFG